MNNLSVEDIGLGLSNHKYYQCVVMNNDDYKNYLFERLLHPGTPTIIRNDSIGLDDNSSQKQSENWHSSQINGNIKAPTIAHAFIIENQSKSAKSVSSSVHSPGNSNGTSPKKSSGSNNINISTVSTSSKQTSSHTIATQTVWTIEPRANVATNQENKLLDQHAVNNSGKTDSSSSNDTLINGYAYNNSGKGIPTSPTVAFSPTYRTPYDIEKNNSGTITINRAKPVGSFSMEFFWEVMINNNSAVHYYDSEIFCFCGIKWRFTLTIDNVKKDHTLHLTAINRLSCAYISCDSCTINSLLRPVMVRKNIPDLKFTMKAASHKVLHFGNELLSYIENGKIVITLALSTDLDNRGGLLGVDYKL